MRRRGVGVWLPLLIGAASGCGAPISNAVFAEEGVFLGALPTWVRLGAPRNLAQAPPDGAPVLAAARVAAEDWNDWFGLLAAAGEEVLATAPDVETPVKRRWESVDVAHGFESDSLGAGLSVVNYQVQTEILKPDDGDVAWTMSMSTDGAWTPVADGVHRVVGGIGQGELRFDLDAAAAVLGATPAESLGSFELSYVDQNPDYAGARTLEAERTTSLGWILAYGIGGDIDFAFWGSLSITDDGLSRLGRGLVRHDVLQGGWGEGEVVGDGLEDAWAYRSCWNPAGDLLWQEGTGLVSPAGETDAACAVREPFSR